MQRSSMVALAFVVLMLGACAGSATPPSPIAVPASSVVSAPLSTPPPTALPTPAPGWTVAQATTCQTTTSLLFDWSKTAPLMVELGLGVSVDVKAARAQGATVAAKYLALARRLEAPGATPQLAALRAAFAAAASEYAQPITVVEFRTRYQAIQSALISLRLQCDAVSAWVDAHVKQ